MGNRTPVYTDLLAEVLASHTHEEMDICFARLTKCAKRMEEEVPVDGKGVAYYGYHYAQADFLPHKRWFARELHLHCKRLDGAS